MSPLAVHIALGLALVESLALSGLLVFRVRGVAGGTQLVLFLFGVGIWIVGNESPNWFGAAAIPVAGWLIAFASLTSVTFLHFAIRFAGAKVPSSAIAAGYALGAATTVLAIAMPPGRFAPWQGFKYFFQPDTLGWIVGLMWAFFGALGHLILFLSWLGQSPARRRQLVAVCLASGLGLLSMTGFAFQPCRIDFFPFPLLLLPLYPVILVYGILRYELMVANAWVRRALAFALLTGSGLVVVGALAVMPLPFGASTATWATHSALVYLAMVLVDPMRALAARIVYPGIQVTDALLSDWRGELGDAADYVQLSEKAGSLLSRQLRIPIHAIVAPDALNTTETKPTLLCSKISGIWQTTQAGWNECPPGPRYTGQAFGSVLAEAAAQLEHARGLADQEREAQQNARLAELGALAATVAHDIRNPLNIISMAAFGTAPEMRREITDQVKRISRLAQDLLDYSKSWRFEFQPLDLAEEVRRTSSQYPSVQLSKNFDDPFEISGDQQRIQQALVNLLDNAAGAYSASSTEGPIGIALEQDADGATQLHICDAGQGVPDEIRTSLFQPFVSRSSNGTGLGLAIVAKIMHAHGGRVSLTERPGWKTCFTLTFPRAMDS